MFTSQVERQFEAAHHNGPEHNRCHNNHGHTWKVLVEFEYDELNNWGWGPDFGVVKQIIDRLDHSDLNAFMKFPSAENVAKFLWTHFNDAFPRARVNFIQIREGGGNTVRYYPE